MIKILDALKKALDFINRHPKLEGSQLLNKESESLASALGKYNSKAEEIELSLAPNYTETAVLIEGEAKSRVSVSFIKEFTKKYCSFQLVFQKADKKARTALLMLAAREDKLKELQRNLDQNQKYREMFHKLIGGKQSDIRAEIMNMPAKDFGGLVTAVALDAPRIKSGAVSSSKTAREKVLKQILRDKMSDELMIGLGRDV
jgi:hypothetical protein